MLSQRRYTSSRVRHRPRPVRRVHAYGAALVVVVVVGERVMSGGVSAGGAAEGGSSWEAESAPRDAVDGNLGERRAEHRVELGQVIPARGDVLELVVSSSASSFAGETPPVSRGSPLRDLLDVHVH